MLPGIAGFLRWAEGRKPGKGAVWVVGFGVGKPAHLHRANECVRIRKVFLNL